jgi:spore germination protein GerM
MMTVGQRARRGLGLAAAATALLLSACGVPTDGKPRAIASDDVPFKLLDQPSTTTTEATAPSEMRAVTVYLLDEKGVLRPTTRSIRAPVTAAKVLTTLLQPASAAESAAGLSTALTADTKLRGLDGPVDGLLTVDLSSSVLNINGRRQIQALAQVVFTMSEVPNVERVLFEFDGRPREVPRGDGDLSSMPLTRQDYFALEPPVTTTTTASTTTAKG